MRLFAGLPTSAVAVGEARSRLRLVAVLPRSAQLLPAGLLLGSILRLRMRCHLRLCLSQHLHLQGLHRRCWFLGEITIESQVSYVAHGAQLATQHVTSVQTAQSNFKGARSMAVWHTKSSSDCPKQDAIK